MNDVCLDNLYLSTSESVSCFRFLIPVCLVQCEVTEIKVYTGSVGQCVTQNNSTGILYLGLDFQLESLEGRESRH